MLKRLAFRLLDACGLVRLAAFLRRHRIIILRYHGVMDDPGEGRDWLSPGPLSRQAFRRQLQTLRRRYRVISLDDALAMLAGRRPVQPYSIVLTFDDGLQNNATVALDVLREQGMTAAFFLTTGFIEHAGRLWTDRLEYAIVRAPAGELVCELGGATKRFALHDRRSRHEALETLKQTMKRMDVADVERCLAEIEAQAGRRLQDDPEQVERTAPMTWEQARGLCRAGMHVGSHTQSHQIITAADERRAREELEGSRRMLEERLERACSTFAYPNGQPGDFDARSARWVAESGYASALTTVVGSAQVGDDLFTLRRIPAGRPVDAYKFLTELSGLLPLLLGWRDGLRDRLAARVKRARRRAGRALPTGAGPS
jgi:peptidoglycan/xylan/chitin deacetylase (PgdA/CDA1 family)